MRIRTAQTLSEAAEGLLQDVVEEDMLASGDSQDIAQKAGHQASNSGRLPKDEPLFQTSSYDGLFSRSTALSHDLASMHPGIRFLCEAMLALFGVQNTWAFLGPHHEFCCPIHVRKLTKRKPVTFWKLITAVYLGRQKLVDKYLAELHVSGVAGVRPTLGSSYNPELYIGNGSAQMIWLESLAASITVAIRSGRQSLAKALLYADQAQHGIVLHDATFFNGRSVFNTAVISTNDPEARISNVATEVVKELLPELRIRYSQDRHHAHLRAILEMSPLSELSEPCIIAVFPLSNQGFEARSCLYMLCRSVLDGNTAETIAMLDIMIRIKSTAYEDWRIDPLEKGPMAKDQFGVRRPKILDTFNPILVAAATSNLEMLHLLFEHWHQLQRYMVLSRHDGRHSKKDEIRSLEQYRQRTALRTDFLRDVVGDIFIYRTRLAGWKTRSAPDSKCLEVLLQHANKELCWGGEIIEAAGTAEVDILKLLINAAGSLNQDFPHKFDDAGQVPFFLKGAAARTIGERALQHAVRQLKVENARLLITKGVRLAEGVSTESFFEGDLDTAFKWVEMQKLLRDAGMGCGSWIIIKPFAATEQFQGTGEETDKTAQAESSFWWSKEGQKIRARGRETTFER